jgi:hypothetical protein
LPKGSNDSNVLGKFSLFIDFIRGDATNSILTIQAKDCGLGKCVCTFLINTDLIKHICASKGHEDELKKTFLL